MHDGTFFVGTYSKGKIGMRGVYDKKCVGVGCLGLSRGGYGLPGRGVHRDVDGDLLASSAGFGALCAVVVDG